MPEASVNTQIANEIAAQMGGIKTLRLFTGSQLIAVEKGLRIQFPADLAAKNDINRVEIVLTDADLYDMTFSRVHRPEGGEMQLDVIETVEGVYNDMLKSIFEDTTMVYLSFA